MEVFLLLVPLVAMVTKVWSNECVDSKCFSTNSSAMTGGLVVSHGCVHSGNKLYKCSFVIMVGQDTSGHQGGCVALSSVPGIHQFFSVGGPAAPPESVDNNKTPDGSVTEKPKDEAIDLRNEYITCIETEVLIGVAIGSFVLGCFITWAIITVLSQCKALQKELRDVQNPYSSRSNGRSRNNFEMSSASAHQRLLSNGSADSYPSSIPSGQLRGRSDDVRNDDGGGRPFPLRQPLPAPPIHEVTLQPYYAQPIDSLYTCTSDKDYQSIQGGSEHYAAVGEGGDYTSLKAQRVKIVTANSSSHTNDNNTNNDYSTIDSHPAENQDGGADASAIYYPASDASNRDYTELIDDCEGDYKDLDPCTQSATSNNQEAAIQSANSDPVKFHVSSFAGYGAPKNTEDSATQISERASNNTNTYTSKNRVHGTKSNVKNGPTMSLKKSNSNGLPDGYELAKSTTMPYKKNNNSEISTAGFSTVMSSQSTDTVNSKTVKTDSIPSNSYASIDDHDYDTCNGSIHDYYVLEEK